MSVLLALLFSVPGFPACAGMPREKVEAIFNESASLRSSVGECEVHFYFQAMWAVRYDQKGRAVAIWQLTLLFVRKQVISSLKVGPSCGKPKGVPRTTMATMSR